MQYAYHAMYASFIFAVIFQVAWLPTSIKGPPLRIVAAQSAFIQIQT